METTTERQPIVHSPPPSRRRRLLLPCRPCVGCGKYDIHLFISFHPSRAWTQAVASRIPKSPWPQTSENHENPFWRTTRHHHTAPLATKSSTVAGRPTRLIFIFLSATVSSRLFTRRCFSQAQSTNDLLTCNLVLIVEWRDLDGAAACNLHAVMYYGFVAMRLNMELATITVQWPIFVPKNSHSMRFIAVSPDSFSNYNSVLSFRLPSLIKS